MRALMLLGLAFNTVLIARTVDSITELRPHTTRCAAPTVFNHEREI